MEEILLKSLPIGIFRINAEQKMLDANEYCSYISGFPKEKLLGEQWLDVIHPEDRKIIIPQLAENMRALTYYLFECRFLCESKGEAWMLFNIAPERANKDSDHFIGTITDITELKTKQLLLKGLDPLTQLPNRLLFEEILKKNLNRARRNKLMLALFYIDIDYFKNVNDIYGHSIGDQFLKEVASRLKQSVRKEDYIVRLGGDEFAIILEDIHNISTISLSAQRIINNFNEPFFIEKNEIQSGMSIGISVYPDEVTTEETIVQHADQALYQAKNSGRTRYQYYNKGMQKKLERVILIAKQLQNAIKENQFELHYQPKVNAKTQAMLGLEALLRWNNPTVQNASPAEFILVAEETGLMHNIGSWVINAAFSQFKKWYDNFDQFKNVTLSLNISAVQLNDSRIIDTVTHALRENDIPTSNILFELTETAVMKKTLDSKSMLLTFLNELGIGLSIDDFGTGYSSLTYLKQLPVKELKIDKSFIDDIDKNINGESIVKAVISLAKTLDLAVVAEGVETKKQLDFLKENHCDIIQGYYFSKPLSVTEMTAYIESTG